MRQYTKRLFAARKPARSRGKTTDLLRSMITYTAWVVSPPAYRLFEYKLNTPVRLWLYAKRNYGHNPGENRERVGISLIYLTT